MRRRHTYKLYVTLHRALTIPPKDTDTARTIFLEKCFLSTRMKKKMEERVDFLMYFVQIQYSGERLSDLCVVSLEDSEAQKQRKRGPCACMYTRVWVLFRTIDVI